MKKIIVDTNIIFSALKGKNSLTRNKIINSQDKYFAPNFLIVEIFKYKEKIVNKSHSNETTTLVLLNKILSKINFVNEENISISNFIKAYKLCKNIDEKDTPFVALSLELELPIWSRDKVLKEGLQKKGFNSFYDE